MLLVTIFGRNYIRSFASVMGDADVTGESGPAAIDAIGGSFTMTYATVAVAAARTSSA